MDIIEIIEIGEPSLTGVSSRPFKCNGDDGHSYFVKLGNAIPDEKINEWIFGFLASLMELPTPKGKVVSVDLELSRTSLIDTSEFGYGIGYGSLEFPKSNELVSSKIDTINPSLQSEILLFDWWILNEDRKLGKLGGNPNILINDDNEISLIDHGNAMDIEFCIDNFFADHALTKTRELWQDTNARRNWEEKAQSCLKQIETKWQALPSEWVSSGATLTFDKIIEVLERPFHSSQSFWQPFT